jgi:transposase
MRRLGMFPKTKAKKPYIPKPYEQMQYPGQRIQIDVKHVSKACLTSTVYTNRLYQYTAIDEYSRLRYLEAFKEKSTHSSATFLLNAKAFFEKHGFTIECVQTDNGFEFTNRLHNHSKDKITLFEKTANQLGIRHKLIRPYTPRHNGKVERSHREDNKRFYSFRTFYSFEDFKSQLTAHMKRTNNIPMRPLRWKSPLEYLSVQYV